MKKTILLLILLLALTTTAQAVNVRGHYRSNGTWVNSHTRTAPDGIKSNNRSYRGW